MATSIAQLTLCQVTSEEIETSTTNFLRKRARNSVAFQTSCLNKSLTLTMLMMTAYWTMYRSFTSSLLWPSMADGLAN